MDEGEGERRKGEGRVSKGEVGSREVRGIGQQSKIKVKGS